MKGERMIRPATREDVPHILALLKTGLMQMRTDGNVNQWKDSTHTFDTVLADVERGECYVVEDDGSMVATFVLMLREESTYSRIDGAWLRDAPYVTIHRLASDGHRGGIAHFVFDWAREWGRDLRVDTHADNLRMQRLFVQYGFVYCGTIWLQDGTPRRAYHFATQTCRYR